METNEKVQNLNSLIERRTNLLSILRSKEDITNLTQSNDKNLAKDFEAILNECKMCDSKIKEYKTQIAPNLYLNFEEENGEIFCTTNETALVVKKENKIINWFKNRINEFRYNYSIERALKRDKFLEDNITNQISSYNAYLNVISSNGNKAIFTKHLNKVTNINQKDLSKNKI